jgi:hypothetical protein
VQQLYLCPTYFEVIIKAKVPLVQAIAPIQVLHLKLLGLVQTFNSAIVLKVQSHQKKLCKSKELLTTTIDIDNLHSKVDFNSGDPTTNEDGSCLLEPSIPHEGRPI